ncbi:ABC transporter permease [Candidatus Bathyarchaeota archaeon]|nr:ABC transporter permease [Candidatus Bathyarchaeota archaeon]
MLRGFGNFLLKELKELIRDPKILLGMIIVPLIMFPILGAVMSFSVQSAQETAGKTTIIILNHDNGTASSEFIAYINSSLRVVEARVATIADAVPLLAENNATVIVEIPADFTRNMTARVGVRVRFSSMYAGSGLLESVGSSVVDALVQQFNRNIAPDLVLPEKSAIVKGKIVEGVDPAMLSSLMLSQAIAMPITMMILLSYSMQIAATSVAMEKEEKTLETVLTLPMDRFAILMGKLSGSIIVAGFGALAYMIGFNYYLGSFTMMIPAGANVDLVSLGLVPSPFGYLLQGISIFVALLSALALAVILSSFAEDVRSAQSMVGYIYPFIYLPSLALIYLDINALPLAVRIIIYAIPYSHPIIASKAITMGDYWTAILGIVYVAVFTVVIMYIASRLFATEKILTAKLRFRGLRRGKKKATEELQ